MCTGFIENIKASLGLHVTTGNFIATSYVSVYLVIKIVCDDK
jgi:hypothetical protein